MQYWWGNPAGNEMPNVNLKCLEKDELPHISFQLTIDLIDQACCWSTVACDDGEITLHIGCLWIKATVDQEWRGIHNEDF